MKNKIICFVTTLFSCFFLISYLIVAPANYLIKVSKYNWLKVLLAIFTVVLICMATYFIFSNLDNNELSKIEINRLRWTTMTEDHDITRICSGDVAYKLFGCCLAISMAILLVEDDKNRLPFNIVSPKRAEFLNKEIKQFDNKLNQVDMSYLNVVVVSLLVFITTYLTPILFGQKPSLYWIDKLCRDLNLDEELYSIVSIFVTISYYSFVFFIWLKIAKPVSSILTLERLNRDK